MLCRFRDGIGRVNRRNVENVKKHKNTIRHNMTIMNETRKLRVIRNNHRSIKQKCVLSTSKFSQVSDKE